MRYAVAVRAWILALCFFGCGGDDSGGPDDLGSLDFAVPQADLTIVTPPKNDKDMAMAICPASAPSGTCGSGLVHVSCEYSGTRCDCDGFVWTCNPDSCPVPWMLPQFGDACTGTDSCLYSGWDCVCSGGHYACSAGDMNAHD